MLWEHVHKPPRVESPVVIVQFEGVGAVTSGIYLPADTFKHGVDRVMFITPVDDLECKPNEEIPNLWVCIMK